MIRAAPLVLGLWGKVVDSRQVLCFMSDTIRRCLVLSGSDWFDLLFALLGVIV